MKQVIIGDIHGYSTWKEIVDKNRDADRIIFIGDYVDSFRVSGVDQLTNLLEIIEYKESNPDKVILLIGNHDYQYMKNGCDYERYSGFQGNMLPAFQEVFEDHKPLFQMSFRDEHDTLYTHAGVSKSWLALNGIHHDESAESINILINSLFLSKPSRFRFDRVTRDAYGEHVNHSPIWIRPTSLMKDAIHHRQVVGHTPQAAVWHQVEENKEVYFIDALPRQYLKCVDGVFSIENLN